MGQPEPFAGASTRFHSVQFESLRELLGKSVDLLLPEAMCVPELTKGFSATRLASEQGLEFIRALGSLAHPAFVGDL